MNDRKYLIAPEGKMYTDGNIYGKEILLANEINPEIFYKITLEEYESIFKEKELIEMEG